MFKNEFQGGPYVEVFSGQGKDPGGPWKLTGGSSVQRVYDDEIKSFVFQLEGTTSTTKMQLPKDARQSLCLTQRFLVIQVYVAHKADFAVEINLSNNSNGKHRVFMSTSQKDLSVSTMLAKVPLFMIKRNTWVSLCLDLMSFVAELWPKQSFRQLDCLVISANCRLARVCTLQKGPADTSDDCEVYGIPREQGETAQEPLPKPLQLSPNVAQVCQVLNVSKLRLIEWRGRSGASASVGGDNSSAGSSRENSAEVPRSAPVSASSAAAAVRHRRSGSEPSGPPLEPHPPPGDSRGADGSRRRRRVRVKPGGSSSAGKEQPDVVKTPPPPQRSSAGSADSRGRGAGAGEEMVATGHRMESVRPQPQPPAPGPKVGIYFFSSQPKAAAPDMTNVSTDGESEAAPGGKSKSSLQPQRAGDSPQHHGASTADGNRRVALLRRSLREISQSVLQERLAAQQQQQQQQQRPNLNLDHLTPGDMSDSFEARMLLSMKAENEDDDDESEHQHHPHHKQLPAPQPQQQRQRAAPDARTRNPRPAGSKLQPTIAGAKRQTKVLSLCRGDDEDDESTRLPMHSRLHLSDDSSDGEEMSTGRSTGRGPLPGPADSLFYLQEMQMCWPGQGGGLATMRLSQETMPIEPVSASPLPPPSGSKNKSKPPAPASEARGPDPAIQEREQRLELLYDPVLNCYYDPESSKYYELL